LGEKKEKKKKEKKILKAMKRFWGKRKKQKFPIKAGHERRVLGERNKKKGKENSRRRISDD
jgi:hypothetical protein